MVNFFMPENITDEEDGQKSVGPLDLMPPQGDNAPIGMDETGGDIYENLLNMSMFSDPNKLLGTGFQKEYSVYKKDDAGNIKYEANSGNPEVETIPAEEFLTSDKYQVERRDLFGTSDAFLNIYYTKDIKNQWTALDKAQRIPLKNALAKAGLINLSKTYGANLDAETMKGIKKAMDFSMDNNGKLSWVAATTMMGEFSQAYQAGNTTTYEYKNEDLEDFYDGFLKEVELRKGAPLSEYETNYFSNKFASGPAAQFLESVDNLAPAVPDTLLSTDTGEFAGFVEGTPAEEPDTSILTDTEDIQDEVFAPREEVSRQADIEDDTFYRIQKNMAGLSTAQSSTPMRRG